MHHLTVPRGSVPLMNYEWVDGSAVECGFPVAEARHSSGGQYAYRVRGDYPKMLSTVCDFKDKQPHGGPHLWCACNQGPLCVECFEDIHPLKADYSPDRS
jgi:hypothetical protein